MRERVVRLVGADGVVRMLGIDAGGRWAPADGAWPAADVGEGHALPGLVDAHAHLTSADPADMDGTRDHDVRSRIGRHAADQLEAGVLLLADKGTHLPATVAMTLELPPEDRPEAQLAGRFLASPGGYYHGYAVEVEPSALAASLDEATPPDATWVKVIGDWPRRGVGAVPNFDESALRAAVAAAHSGGRKVAIHTAAPDTPGMAVRAGVDSIEHGLFLTEDDVAMLGGRGGAWVPTIAAMEILAEQLGPASSGGRLLAEGLHNVRRLLPDAVAAGVNVMAGTDLALRHGEVAREAARMVDYGMDERDVVAALTEVPRRYFDVAGFVPGRPADFIVVDAPDSVAALAAPRLVVRCGVVVADRR